MTSYISQTDDDGLVWPGGIASVGDHFYVRDTSGNAWRLKITAITITVPGPTGYSTVTGTVLSTSGSLTKNKRIQVNLVEMQPGDQGPPGDPGVTIVNHGTNGAMARPAGAIVAYWIGTATPANALAYDWWKDS